VKKTLHNDDIFTGKAKIFTSSIDEIHTGSLWEPARRKYCGHDPDAFPLTLVCFYDTSQKPLLDLKNLQFFLEDRDYSKIN
jgi:hypothetical protein